MAEGEILVGDIGGTNARFAVARPDGSLRDVRILKVTEHGQFEDALKAYLATCPGERPGALAIASAGALQNDTIYLTNASWSLSESALKASFGFQHVRLFNDFQAQARFAGTMSEEAWTQLAPGQAVEGAPVLTIGPGTGFGQALFVPGDRPSVIATEGGHRLLPVRDARELRLYLRLAGRLGHPPILEEALSGRGLVNLFDQVVIDAGEVPAPTDPPAVTAAALAGPGHARDAVLWFLELLATAAADACLSTGARGGVVVSGGITGRLAQFLPEANFAGVFARPGILRDYLEHVPVRMVTDPHAALYGVADLLRES